MNIAGIVRSKRFSPNSNDMNIMEGVKEQLVLKGHTVCFYEEDELAHTLPCEKLIFSMARGEETLQQLSLLQKKGAMVINSAQGVQNCQRSCITHIMHQTEAYIPNSIVFEPQHAKLDDMDITYPCWLKRSDISAQEKNDVCFILNKDELQIHIADFKERQIKEAMLMQHIEGDIVKFYGVAKTNFFYCYYPTHSKFGLEQHNGSIQQYAFSKEHLKTQTDKIALKANVFVYGGDCIVTPEGKPYIIDFNDWPSFSPCIQEASKAITNLLLQQIP